MTWHYELCKIKPKKDKSYYAIREVYEGKGKKDISWTEDNITPIADNKLEMIDILVTMLKDVCYHPIRRIREK